MDEEQKKEYLLDGLNCGHCAAMIGEDLKKLDGVSHASVDFATGSLVIAMDGTKEPDAVFAASRAIVNGHDASVRMIEKNAAADSKKTLFLRNLDCAACAAKIETKVRLIPGVRAANLDFVQQKLTIEAEAAATLPRILRAAGEAIRETEEGVTVSYQPEDQDAASKKHLLRPIGLGLGAALFAIALAFPIPPGAQLALFIAAYLLTGGEVLLRAAGNIRRGRVFDENFLMTIATLGAFAIGEYPEGVAVMLFYQVGEAFQRRAVNHSRRSITSLLDIRPDFANLQIGDTIRKVRPEEVAVGDTIIVQPGEKIPLDGTVVEGRSSLDTSALTGESLPQDVAAGSPVLSGAINKNGLLKVEVTKVFGESTVTKILDLVQNAGSKKAEAENFITKFARYYTPAVVLAALTLALLPPLLLPGAAFGIWFHRALVFLVISCPCALVISIPLSFFGGIGGASKNGILVKGGNYLEALGALDTVVFDKTGTLTKGVFQVTEVVPSGISREELLEIAAHAECHSSHPIAASIRQFYGQECDGGRIGAYEEMAGGGIHAEIDGAPVLAGNAKLLAAAGIAVEEGESAGTVVHIAVGQSYRGRIVIADEAKEDSGEAIKSLQKLGVRRIAMFTGDRKEAAAQIAAELGIDTVYAELLPQDKVSQLEDLRATTPARKKLAFVGDGINDAPVLARADIGIAMGALGSDAAIEAADVVLMTDEPTKLATAIRIAGKTRRIVWQNVFLALAVKGILLLLGAFGLATMWEAVFSDVGVALLAILNAMRVMRFH